jgi:hypothetical protein
MRFFIFSPCLAVVSSQAVTVTANLEKKLEEQAKLIKKVAEDGFSILPESSLDFFLQKNTM